jgi:cytochrome c
MNRILFSLLAMLSFCNGAMANSSLAQQKNCMTCHNLEKKVVGPAYKDVASKYAGQDVNVKLAAKVINGGAGVWGPLAMPPNPQVSKSEAETLVKWVLSLK